MKSQPDKILIPITVRFRTIDGEDVMVDAEYAEIDVDIIAQLLASAFDFSIDKNQRQDEVTE